MREKHAVYVLSVLLAVALGANAALAVVLYRSPKVDVRKTRHNAWKSCRKLSMQHLLYRHASERARRERRQLVVIGNPTGGWVNKVVPIYECGDICIDIAGCAPCGPETRVLKADAVEALKTVPTDSAVVFESETLEYVANMAAAVRELDRITGHDHTRIFAVHSISIDEWLYHTRGMRPDKPTLKAVKKRRQKRMKYARTGEGLARRIIYRYPPRDRYHWSEI